MATYTAKIEWNNDSPEGFSTNRYTRGHTWEFDGGVTVPASSSPHAVRVPYSVEANVDPEEALVASASSCHMLSFLYVASQAGFVAESYVDNAVGELTAMEDGRQWMSTILLDPTIAWIGEKLPTASELSQMHDKAHHMCYIANSLKTEVSVKRPDAAAEHNT